MKFCETLKERIYALRVLPHVKPLKEIEAVDTMQKQFFFLCQKIQDISSAGTTNSGMYITNIYLMDEHF